MSVKSYKKSQKVQLTDNFNLSEFACKGASCGCTEVLHDPNLSKILQQIRDQFGKPLRITSGYRCPKHNEAVGGVSNSLHTKGMAADIIITGIKPEEIAKYAQQIGVKGIGLYGPEDGNFVHIDTREKQSFWLGHKQVPVKTFLAEKSVTGVYVVTCRVNGQTAVETLIFDSAVGEQIQCVGTYDAAVQMTYTDHEAKFTPVSIGKDTAEIMKVTKFTSA